MAQTELAFLNSDYYTVTYLIRGKEKKSNPIWVKVVTAHMLVVHFSFTYGGHDEVISENFISWRFEIRFLNISSG